MKLGKLQRQILQVLADHGPNYSGGLCDALGREARGSHVGNVTEALMTLFDKRLVERAPRPDGSYPLRNYYRITESGEDELAGLQ